MAKIFLAKIFLAKGSSLSLFYRNILVQNVFDKNIFGNNIFLGRDLTSLPHPAIDPIHTTPTPSYLLFEVGGGDERTKDSWTGRTYVLSLLLY